jgi:hypothetical protein
MTKQTGRYLLLAVLCSALSAPALLAQSDSTQPAPPPPSQPSQNQTGVSQPPPDSAIQADEDLPPPAPAPAPLPKPSAAIPAAPAAAAPVAPVQPARTSAPVFASANGEFSAQVDNTDDGIVTVVQAPGSPAPLQARPDAGPGAQTTDADNGIVNYVPYNPNDLGAGTNITVRLSQDLSTADTEPGTPFKGVVTRNVYNGDRLVIPVGSEVRGRVTYVAQGHHLGPHASMHLRPENILLPDGTGYHLYADVVATNAPGTHANDEGGIVASTHYKKDAIEYGAGVGTGAVVGGAIGGPVGAGVGTLVGAGAVTTHMLLQDPQAANLPAGTTLVFSLTQPMGLTPLKN